MSNTISSDLVAVAGKQIKVEGTSNEGIPYLFYKTWIVDLAGESTLVNVGSKFKHKDVLMPTHYTTKAGEERTSYDLAPDQAVCKEAFVHLTNYVQVSWTNNTAP
tara:strand:- start:94 stop:408 length:315 start_codon:yes stop_codon:yes gene_type:complete